MKRLSVLLIAVLALGCVGLSAQKKSEQKAFEEATTRLLPPEVKVFIRPLVCDLQLLTTERESFGPYPYELTRSIGQITEMEYENYKNRAKYMAAKEADADALMEAIVHTYVNADNDKLLYVEISGYPVKYTNFHTIKPEEVDVIEKVYTRSYWQEGKKAREEFTVGETRTK